MVPLRPFCRFMRIATSGITVSNSQFTIDLIQQQWSLQISSNRETSKVRSDFFKNSTNTYLLQIWLKWPKKYLGSLYFYIFSFKKWTLSTSTLCFSPLPCHLEVYYSLATMNQLVRLNTENSIYKLTQSLALFTGFLITGF